MVCGFLAFRSLFVPLACRFFFDEKIATRLALCARLWLAFLALPCRFESSKKSIDKVWILRLRLRMTRFKQTPCKLLVILSDSEVSTNLKCEFAPLKREFFTLNLKYVLNSVDISLSLNMTIWIFRFLSKAQNDKILVI